MTDQPIPDGYKYPARPTRFAGVEFRSRLEATWAAFFSLAQWWWEYEPKKTGAVGWLPDFRITARPAPGRARTRGWSTCYGDNGMRCPGCYMCRDGVRAVPAAALVEVKPIKRIGSTLGRSARAKMEPSFPRVEDARPEDVDGPFPLILGRSWRRAWAGPRFGQDRWDKATWEESVVPGVAEQVEGSELRLIVASDRKRLWQGARVAVGATRRSGRRPPPW